MATSDIPVFWVVEVDRDDPSHHWLRPDTGEVFGHRPHGAMWWSDMTEGHRPTGPDDWRGDADMDMVRDAFARYPDIYPGPSDLDPTLPKCQPSYTFTDGLHLCVQCPGGSWNIDSRASNCTMPYDYEHRCWIWHGDPPVITVDKNGVTCQAGAGSILVGQYHGFLRGGVLVPA